MNQRTLMDRQFKAIAERDETFFLILPSLTHAELETLIAKHPRWARYSKFLGTLDNGSQFEV